MVLELQLLVSSVIKRKKPWTKIAWIGEEKEDVVLLDYKRISFLYLPSGETRKKIGKINQQIESSLCVVVTSTGSHLVALLHSGDIVIWKKDADTLFTIKSCPLVSSGMFFKEKNKLDIKDRPLLFVSQDCSKLIVVLNLHSIFLWLEKKWLIKRNDCQLISGNWIAVPLDPDIALASIENKNCVFESVLPGYHETLAISAVLCFVFIRDGFIRFSIGIIQNSILSEANIFEIGEKNMNTLNVEWKCPGILFEDIDPLFEAPMEKRGAIQCKLTHDGLCLAVVVNQQDQDRQSNLLFVSVLSGAVKKINLKNNQQLNYRKRQNWVSDLCWTADDCLLILITKDGSFSIASRVGQLLSISVDGSSFKMGPANYLYPFSIYSPNTEINKTSSKTIDEESDISTLSAISNSKKTNLIKPRFSLGTHPKSPLIILSDGFNVTVLEIPHSFAGILNISSSLLTNCQELLNIFRSTTTTTLSNTKMNLNEDWKVHQLRSGFGLLVVIWSLIASFNHPLNEDLFYICSKIVDVFCNNIHISPETALETIEICLGILEFDVFRNLQSISVKLINSALIKLIKNCENRDSILAIINQSYSFLIKCESRVVSAYQGDSQMENQSSTLIESLMPAWSELYKVSTQLYQSVDKLDKSKLYRVKEIREIFCRIQFKIQSKGWKINERRFYRNPKNNRGIDNYLQGHPEKAIKIWLEQLYATKRKCRSKKVHRILYCLIAEKKIEAALAFISAILYGQFNREIQSPYSPNVDELFNERKRLDILSRSLKSRGTRKLLTTFARFLTSFFTKKDIFVYPAHKPKPLTSFKHKEGLRSVYISHSLINDALNSQKLDAILVPRFVLELLILLGLWSEASHFALESGHWRLAFILSAILQRNKTHSIADNDANHSQIIINKLREVLNIANSSSSEFSSTKREYERVENVRDLLSAAVLCDVNPVPVLLQDILNELQSMVAEIPLLVPGDLHLPAPPVYCPQQCVGYEESDLPSQDSEAGFRHNFAIIVEKYFAFLQSSNLSFPIMAWYLAYFNILWKAEGSSLEESSIFSTLYQALQSVEESDIYTLDWSVLELDEGAQKCLQTFRELIAILWMLYCRDKLSLAFRKLETFLVDLDSPKKIQNYHYSLLYEIVEWSEYLLPFSKYSKSHRTSLQVIILNAAHQIPLSKKMIFTLARCFPLTSDLSFSASKRLTELQEKWKMVPTEMEESEREQTNVVTLPRTKRKSKKVLRENEDSSQFWITSFHNCQLEELHFRTNRTKKINLAFEELRGIVQNEKEPTSCELNPLFLQFLEPVFQIGILKHADNSRSRVETKTPLILAFKENLLKEELKSEKEASEYFEKQENGNAISSPLLDLFESCSISSSKILDFGGGKTFKRSSVLFRQRIGSFWSSSRSSIEKLQRILNQSEKKRPTTSESFDAVSKWRSTQNLLTKGSRQKFILSSSSSSSSSSSKSLCSETAVNCLMKRAKLTKPDGYISRLTLYTSLLKNQSLLTYCAWLHNWALKKPETNCAQLYLLPTQMLLPFVLEYQEKLSPSTPISTRVISSPGHSTTGNKLPVNKTSLTSPKRVQKDEPRIEINRQEEEEKKEFSDDQLLPTTPKRKPIRLERNLRKENDLKETKSSSSLRKLKDKSFLDTFSKICLPQVLKEKWQEPSSKSYNSQSLILNNSKPEEATTTNNAPIKAVSAIRPKSLGESSWVKEVNGKEAALWPKSVYSSIREQRQQLGTLISLEKEPENNKTRTKMDPETKLPQIEMKLTLEECKNSISSSTQTSSHLFAKDNEWQIRKISTFKNEEEEEEEEKFRTQNRKISKKGSLPPPLLKLSKIQAKERPKRYEHLLLPYDELKQKFLVSSPKNDRKTVLPLLRVSTKEEQQRAPAQKEDEETVNSDQLRKYLNKGKLKIDFEENKMKAVQLLGIDLRSSSSSSSPQREPVEKPLKQFDSSEKETLISDAVLSLESPADKDGKSLINGSIDNQSGNYKTRDEVLSSKQSSLSPDSFARLQYSVYERLYKDTISASTQTPPPLQKDVVPMFQSADPPNQSTNDLTKINDNAQQIEPEKSFLTDFEEQSLRKLSAKRRAIALPLQAEKEEKQLVRDGESNLPQIDISSHLEKYSKTDLKRNELKRKLSNKLQEMQKQMNAIESITNSVETDLQNTKQALTKVESFVQLKGQLKNDNIETNSQLKTSSSEATKKNRNLFDSRKNTIMLMMDYENANEIPSSRNNKKEEEQEEEEDRELVRGKKRISFGETKTVFLERFQPSLEDTFEVLQAKQFLNSRSTSFNGLADFNSIKRRELYKIYGSKRIPDRFLDKFKHEGTL